MNQAVINNCKQCSESYNCIAWNTETYSSMQTCYETTDDTGPIKSRDDWLEEEHDSFMDSVHQSGMPEWMAQMY